MRELAAFLQNFGIKLHGAADIRPKDIQDVLTRVEGTPESNIISTVTLRSLKKARYDVEPVEHFGLAADRYCHFTSPIRRYPDLCVHRIIRLWLDGKLDARRKKRLEKELPGIAAHSSERERNAIEAERAVNDMTAAEYMSLRIGEEFEGVISGVTGFGVFVELENTVEGMVPLGSMEDDYYIYYEKQYCLIGEKTKKRVTLGDKARVRVVSTDIPAGKIEFGFAE
jgi:ribonuclease R